MNRSFPIVPLIACLMLAAAVVLDGQNLPGPSLATTPRAITSFIRSDDFDKFDDLVAKLIDERSSFNRGLLAIFTDGKSSNYQKCAAAYFLGEIRATNAVNVLAKSINLSLTHDTDHISILSMPPAVEALVKIGIPAIPAVVRNLAESDDSEVRRLSLRVLDRVEGDSDVVQLRLKKAVKAEKDPVKAGRLQAAMKSFNEDSLGK